MPTTAASLIQKVRRYVGDWPDQDVTTASVSSVATTVSVADTTKFFVSETIEIDYEAMIVRSLSTASSLSVTRASYGSTVATHASGASILRKPAFLSVTIMDALNAGITSAFPMLYRPVYDTSLTGSTSTYEFTVPNMPDTYGGDSIAIPYVSRVSVKEPGDDAYREERAWEVVRGSTPKLKFRRDPTASATIRVEGFGPFPALTDTSSSLHALWPKQAELALVRFAGSYLLESGEAGRVRADAGKQNDQRETANRTGSSMQAANAIYQRYITELRSIAMPPMPRHVKATF